MMKQKVVVIGHGFTSRLSIIRAVGQIGCEVTVIVLARNKKITGRLDKSMPVDCRSKYVTNVYWCHNNSEELVQILLNKCVDGNQKVIIIPDSDFSTVVVDDNKEILSKHFLFPHIIHSPSSIRYWMNKENQKALASAVGLKYASSQRVDVRNGRYMIPDGIPYPCFTKPIISITGGKHYFRRCSNEKELRKLLDFVGTRENATILIEQFIDIEKEYALLGFSDGKEVVIPGVIQFIENSKSHFGIAMRGQIMPSIGFELLLEQFKLYVLRMGFVGVFDIDFFYGENKWWFGEMNLRFGGSGHAVTRMGVNLPGMLVKSLCGECIADMAKEIKQTATYVNERMCIDDYLHSYISIKKYKESVTKADIRFVFDRDDPEPQKMLKRELFVIRIKRLLFPIREYLKKLNRE